MEERRNRADPRGVHVVVADEQGDVEIRAGLQPFDDLHVLPRHRLLLQTL
jgi:hypothetical protein